MSIYTYKTPKVLVVEDNYLNLKLFCDLLSAKGCEVLTSRSGRDVIEIVNNTHLSLILMDIQLGQVSGIDIIQALKNNKATSNIPIIAVTALVMKNEEDMICASGCDLYLAKPVSIDVFFAAIQKYICLKDLGAISNFSAGEDRLDDLQCVSC